MNLWVRRSEVIQGIVQPQVISIFSAIANESSADPTIQPRLQSTDMQYLGAFALPQGQYGGSSFAYGGHGVTPYKDPTTGQMTLFMEGHAWYPGNVAQVGVPASLVKTDNWRDLPKASVLQNFHDITDGKSSTLNSGKCGNNFIYGMLPYNGRLIVAASNYYDASNSQDRSHGFSSFNLSATSDFQGFFAIDAVASPRSLGGYMGTVPAEWQSLFGGGALTGNCCLSIIANSSSGPALTVFDPDDLGTGGSVTGTTLLYYPVKQALGNGFYAPTGTDVKGVAFPAGSRSVLFFGIHTNSGYCYGPGTSDPSLAGQPADGGVDTWCYDPCSSSKGGHGYPYYHNVWA